jgi:hypothetical protein
VKRLETVPGVGPIVALTTIAVFVEISRFESAKPATSYAGLVPSTFQSGERDAHGHDRPSCVSSGAKSRSNADVKSQLKTEARCPS